MVWSAGASCPSCVLSPPLGQPQPPGLRGKERLGGKALVLCTHRSDTKKLECYHHSLVAHAKHSTIQNVMKKINSIPARPTAPSNLSRNLLFIPLEMLYACSSGSSAGTCVFKLRLQCQANLFPRMPVPPEQVCLQILCSFQP